MDKVLLTTPQDARAPTYARAYSWLTAWAALTFAVVFGFARLSYGLLLPALRADLSGSYSAFGQVASANLAGYLLGTLALPFVTARIVSARGRNALNTASIVIASVTMAAAGTSTDLVQLGVWRLLSGAFSAPATVLTLALILERVAPDERGRASGIIWMGLGLGLVFSGLVAPLVIGAGAASLWRFAWAAMGAVGIIAAGGLYRSVRRAFGNGAYAAPISAVSANDTNGAEAAERVTLGAVLKQLLRPRGLLWLTLAYFAFGGGYIIYFTYFIALVKQQGVPSLLAGFVWSALGAAGIVGGIVWGRLSDRWPTGFLLALALAFGVVGSLFVQGLAVEAVGALLVGTIIGVPALVTLLLQRAVPAAYYTASLSLMTAAVGFGQIIGPILGGAVVDARGLAVGTATTAVVLALAAVCAAMYGVAQRNMANSERRGAQGRVIVRGDRDRGGVEDLSA